jgi:hypothetical protein
MIAHIRYLILAIYLLSSGVFASAQSNYFPIDTVRDLSSFKPPKNREIFHDYIDKGQKTILKSDGKNDGLYTPSANEEINFLLTKSLISRVDQFQYNIEKDTSLSHQDKVRYLRGMENVLKFFVANRASKKINAVFLPDIISGYELCMQEDKAKKTIEKLIESMPYETGYSIIRADRNTFEKNAGYKTSLNIVVLKYCLRYPERTFLTLKDNPDVPFADSLVRVVSKKYPRQLYDYAAAGNKLGAIIRNINDDIFISSVAKMARSKSGQQYFPFLDNIVNGRMTIEEIDAVKDDSLAYYRLLVKTQMEYVTRALNKDTAFEFRSLTKKLETKAREVYVNTINALHDENAEFRFRIIQPLTAEELYYLIVSSDGLIYTSSFVKGIYPLMMKKVNYRGDSLLISLKFDRYRKFIKMAAGYNTLSDFLNSFPPRKSPTDESDAEKLMKAFVGKLETGDGLENGVDVADSYASIAETLKPIANEMLNNVQLNYQRNVSQNNKRGMAIYNILHKLFLSADSTKGLDLTKELGIPPVYEVPYKMMANDSGTVVIQVFMYGDRDGIGVFPSILGLFNNANWKIDRSNPQWVTIRSIKGKPVSIYLNKPLPEEKSEDAKAQEALCKYLESNKLFPAATINRGHSYNAPYTIEQMFPSSRIVFMGSCGGYQMVHDILEKAPDAHIVGTKQIADAPVNNPFLKLLAEKLRNGNNIEWIPFWKELDNMITDEIFDDYVPPYKNLGALFIKAYKIAMGEDELKE